MKWIFRLVLVVVAVGLVWVLWQRLFVTDETRIGRQIAMMERAVEQGNLLRLSAGISQDYRDGYGLDKTSLLAAVRSYRGQYGQLFIHITGLDIEVASDRENGQAVLIARVMAKPVGEGQETELVADRFRLTFRRTDDDWKLVNLETPELKFD